MGVKRLVFLGTDRVTSESYVSMLSKVFTKLKMKGRWLMQDGAPAHSARNTKQYLKRKRIRELRFLCLCRTGPLRIPPLTQKTT